MAKQRVSCQVLALAFYANINVFVGATSIVPFFSDSSCQDSIFTGQTNQQAFNGTCQPVSQDANSVDPSHLDSCCAVTVYTDPYCSDNPTLAPNGTCTSLSVGSIGSYSVDCPCFPSASAQSTPNTAAPSTSSTSQSTSSTSVSASPTSEPTPVPSSSSSMTTATSFFTTSSSTEDVSPKVSTAPSTDPPLLPSSSSESSSPSSTSAAAKGGGGGGGGSGSGLGVPAQIAIGVIIPTLGIIVAVIFGIRMWPRR